MAQYYIFHFDSRSGYHLWFFATSERNCSVHEKAIPHYQSFVLGVTGVVAVGVSYQVMKFRIDLAGSVRDPKMYYTLEILYNSFGCSKMINSRISITLGELSDRKRNIRSNAI